MTGVVRTKVVVALAGIALVVALAASATAPRLASAQAESCHWTKIGQMSMGFYHGFAAFDPDGAHGVIIGGISGAGGIVDEIRQIDLVSGAVTQMKITGTHLPRVGVAGDVRVRPGASALYALGGGEAPLGAFLYEGRNDVQELVLATAAMARVTPDGVFSNRMLHVARYDPVHDMIVVHGGTRDCTVRGADPGGATPQVDCNADYGDTLFLKFDLAGGSPRWEAGPSANGPGKLVGHSMVYDSDHHRMVVYGGSLDGDRGLNETYVLDLAAGAAPAWRKLATTGTGPSGLFLHAAEYDAEHRRMVVYGGVQSRAFTQNEAGIKRTWVLEFDPADANKATWRELPGASIREAAGASMLYDPQAKTVLLVGGRADLSSSTVDVNTAVYRLDCSVATPTATATPRPPTATPGTGSPTAQPTAGPTATRSPETCPLIVGRVPQQVVQAALASPAEVRGYGQVCQPGLPPGRFNPVRSSLSLDNPNSPYHPLFNSLVWKCGCP